MPTVFNGIGTWYYGKRRVHTINGTCQFCGRQTDLVSYDTTLFFVVVFVPVFPIQRKRILQQCSSCQKHRVISLAKWEEAKERDGAELLELLSSNPDNREAILRAIGFSIAYQDEPLFNKIVDTLATDKTGDAAIQARLGDAYAFFALWPRAEQAYRTALRVEDNDAIREQLAWALLKQDRPDEARPYLQHVIDARKRASAGMIYLLVQGYQAQGRHEEALAIMDERDRAFPDAAALKDYQRQRKTSTRLRSSDRKIRSAILTERKSGYREGTWTASLPRWIGVFLVLAGLLVYLGSAFWIGQARKVFFVNGTNKPYSVVVQGTTYSLAPNTALPIRIAEGDVQVSFSDNPQALEPVQCRIETSFWSRPLSGHTFVINPDQSAIVLEEETFYAAANPRVAGPPKVHFGSGFYRIDSLDYEFENFPATLSVKGNAEVRKTRVALAPAVAPEMRLYMLLGLPQPDQIQLCQRVLRLDPSNALFLHWLTTHMPPQEAIAFVEPRLNDRPILVEWHRAYQSLMERAHPETDLRPRYRDLLGEAKDNADALYLLGRADPDWDEAEKLYRQAALAALPSGYACYSLGYRAMSEAHFAEARGWLEKALPLLAEKSLPQQLLHDALLANGDYDVLLSALQRDAQVPGGKTSATLQMIRVHAVRGDKAKAQAALAQVFQMYSMAERATAQKPVEATLCCFENNDDGYLKAIGDTPSFEAAILRGQLTQAAELAKTDELQPSTIHGLLYLQAARSGPKELAETYWGTLLTELKKGSRDEQLVGEVLSGRKPLTARLPQRLAIEPSSKRVLLAVLAQRYPDQAKEMLTLARKLDFQHDAVSLCLRKILQQP